MDSNIDTVREALENARAIAAYIEQASDDEGLGVTQDAKQIRDIITDSLAALSDIDPDAIRREFWDELHAEAETQYDRRLELLGPIETLDDAAFRKTLADGWSAWLLARRKIEYRKARESNL